MEGAASAEKGVPVEDFRVRSTAGRIRSAGVEGAATTFGRDDAGWAPRPPDDANASKRIVTLRRGRSTARLRSSATLDSGDDPWR